jgi:hypothetical protein
VAAGVSGDVDRGGDAADGVLEREVQFGLDVSPALGAGLLAAAAAAAEETTEQVAEVAGVLDPPGNPPADGPMVRTSSYSLRLSASPRTS